MAKDKDYDFLCMLKEHEQELIQELSAVRTLIVFTQNRIDTFVNGNHIICDHHKYWADAEYQKKKKKERMRD